MYVLKYSINVVVQLAQPPLRSRGVIIVRALDLSGSDEYSRARCSIRGEWERYCARRFIVLILLEKKKKNTKYE